MNHGPAVTLDELVYARVSGADAHAFLQGQLSGDLRQLRSERAQISSYNSPKGRMLAVLHLIADGDAVLLELHRSIADAVLKRLRMFVLRAKVTIEPADLRALGFIGAGGAAALNRLGLPEPPEPLDCAEDPGRSLRVLRRLGETPRYSVLGAATQINALAARLPPPLTYDAWRRADIESGVPVVYSGTSDHFVPQMANLDLFGGISFDKGCYTGQEIVARLHYLGQLKRRLFVCRVEGAAPAPGSAVVDGEAATPMATSRSRARCCSWRMPEATACTLETDARFGCCAIRTTADCAGRQDTMHTAAGRSVKAAQAVREGSPTAL
jgi:tRNA-modifying protein YgfZ